MNKLAFFRSHRMRICKRCTHWTHYLTLVIQPFWRCHIVSIDQGCLKNIDRTKKFDLPNHFVLVSTNWYTHNEIDIDCGRECGWNAIFRCSFTVSIFRGINAPRRAWAHWYWWFSWERMQGTSQFPPYKRNNQKCHWGEWSHTMILHTDCENDLSSWMEFPRTLTYSAIIEEAIVTSVTVTSPPLPLLWQPFSQNLRYLVPLFWLPLGLKAEPG
jgi:hypothetical protein